MDSAPESTASGRKNTVTTLTISELLGLLEKVKTQFDWKFDGEFKRIRGSLKRDHHSVKKDIFCPITAVLFALEPDLVPIDLAAKAAEKLCLPKGRMMQVIMAADNRVAKRNRLRKRLVQILFED